MIENITVNRKKSLTDSALRLPELSLLSKTYTGNLSVNYR